ncbi:CAP domain-containing protein [Streptomyces fagopyri]|nr:CAP domain-containing protein [Streptomyces fagopyri]
MASPAERGTGDVGAHGRRAGGKGASAEGRWSGGPWTSWRTVTTARPATVPGSPAPAARLGAPDAAAPGSRVVDHVVALVNRARGKAGCSPVTLNAKLSKAARRHSADMAGHRNMSHRGSDGSGPGRRITRAGYDWSAYGENVAYGYSTAAAVMAAWMSSPGHRRNILTCGFTEIGVGLAQPGSYWTQDFGTGRRSVPSGSARPSGVLGGAAAGRA